MPGFGFGFGFWKFPDGDPTGGIPPPADILIGMLTESKEFYMESSSDDAEEYYFKLVADEAGNY